MKRRADEQQGDPENKKPKSSEEVLNKRVSKDNCEIGLEKLTIFLPCYVIEVFWFKI